MENKYGMLLIGAMNIFLLVLFISLPWLSSAAHEACTSIRGASSCRMLQHSISDKLKVQDLDLSAGQFFKQLESLSLPSTLCDNVFRATMCTMLMPPCNSTEFAAGDYRHQKPCKFLELYLSATCGLKLPVGDLSFGEAPDCFVPNILEPPACAASTTAALKSQTKSQGPKLPKLKSSKTPKVNFAHLLHDWELAASLVEGKGGGGQPPKDNFANAPPAADPHDSEVIQGAPAPASNSCQSVAFLQTEALIELGTSLDTLGASEHAHFAFLQALHVSSISQQPASIDVVRRIFALMHAAVEGAATSKALVDIHLHSADASLRKCLSEHSGLADDVTASKFISEEAKVKELRKLQQRFDLDTFIETGTYFGVTLGGLIDDFERLVSVEISKSLFDTNSKRFQGQKHVSLLQGDSREILPKIIKELPSNARSLFWLDGHFSGSKFETSRVDIDSPVISELHTVLSHATSDSTVIAIDDARMFLGHQNCSGLYRSECYPKISQVAHVVCIHKPSWSIQISGDMIKIFPNRKTVKSPSESKKIRGPNTSDRGFQCNDTCTKNDDTSSAASSSARSFSVKASQKNNVPKMPTSKSKGTKPSGIAPPKQKDSTKVRVEMAIPQDADSNAVDAHRVPPPKKTKNQGRAKVNVVAVTPELSVEDAYDYEL